jgi:hypothetical protein
MISCGFPRSCYDEGQPARCWHAFITDVVADGFFRTCGQVALQGISSSQPAEYPTPLLPSLTTPDVLNTYRIRSA